jgi:hypothetical protein
MKRFHQLKFMACLLSLVVLLSPASLWACACGCGVFEVGTSAMFPTHEGGMAFLEYDYQNQNRNWNGASPSSADNNRDKKIITNFFTLGYQYLFNRSWGVMGELPYTNRYFKTTDEDTGDIVDFTHSSIGDVRIKAIYTGLSEDLSTGLTFGLRLPTGSYKYEHFDPDVQIGSGSTDLLLGGYHMGPIPVIQHWNWFANAEADVPVLHYAGYEPGTEIDAAAGAYYNNWRIGPVKVAPLAQLIGSHRWSDSGWQADAEDTGFSRILIAPGVEFDAARVRVYTDIGFPIYQYTTGNQLVAAQFFKLNISYHF